MSGRSLTKRFRRSQWKNCLPANPGRGRQRAPGLHDGLVRLVGAEPVTFDHTLPIRWLKCLLKESGTVRCLPSPTEPEKLRGPKSSGFSSESYHALGFTCIEMHNYRSFGDVEQVALSIADVQLSRLKNELEVSPDWHGHFEIVT